MWCEPLLSAYSLFFHSPAPVYVLSLNESWTFFWIFKADCDAKWKEEKNTIFIKIDKSSIWNHFNGHQWVWVFFWPLNFFLPNDIMAFTLKNSFKKKYVKKNYHRTTRLCEFFNENSIGQRTPISNFFF